MEKVGNPLALRALPLSGEKTPHYSINPFPRFHRVPPLSGRETVRGEKFAP